MSDLLDLGAERFVSLTTYRRSGEPVSTPVWVARDGDHLVVLTPAGSGKVTRIRNDPRVELRPCGRFGAVADGAPALAGTATLHEEGTDAPHARAVLRRAYPVESRLVLGIERTLERLRRRPPTPRLAVHIAA